MSALFLSCYIFNTEPWAEIFFPFFFFSFYSYNNIQSIDAFELWCWRRLLRVLWIARRSALERLWKEWCWSWNFSTLATSCEELTHWKRPWCWEGLVAGGEGDDRGWDGWMVTLTRWTRVWVNSWSWWWTGRSGVLRFMGSQRVGHDWVTELTELADWNINMGASLVTQLVKTLPAIPETWVLIPGLGRSPGEGKGYLLQYSGLENSMDFIVHGVSKSQTQLSDFHFHFIKSINPICVGSTLIITSPKPYFSLDISFQR